MPRLLVLLLLLTLPASAGPWPLFTSTDFRVRMPAPPRIRTEARATPVGEVAIRNWSVHAGSASFTVTLVDMPSLALTLQGPEALLDRAAQTVLEKRKGRNARSRAARPYGLPGREMSYEAPGEAPMGQTRMFFVGPRLFVLDTLVPTGSEAGARFLDSFELLRR